MKHVSICAGFLLGGLSLSLLTLAGCLKEVGLGDSSSVGFGAGGGSVVSGEGVGGSGAGGAEGHASVGSGAGGATAHAGVGGSGASASGSGGATVHAGTGGSGSSTQGVGGGSSQGCQLGAQPVPCDFSHLNADCASYGAVCDFVFSQCSCCFVHDQLTCMTDGDCESSFGASSFCSAGICACK